MMRISCNHADWAALNTRAKHLVRVPSDVARKQDLIQTISSALRFPAYCGSNWDALDECLGELSWLEPGEVVIWHDALPLSSQLSELKRYLGVLREVREESGTRAFVISFPISSKTAVEKAAS